MQSPGVSSDRGFTLQRNPGVAKSSYDPCAGIEFNPSLGSDELFEALKRSFPSGKNHRARVREALIEFLIAEREADRSRSKSPNRDPSSKALQQEQGPKHGSDTGQESTIPGIGKPETNVSRKGTLPSGKPASASEVGIDITDQRSSQVDVIQPKAAMTKAAVDKLTIVWSSADGLAQKPRMKRAMTGQELEQYRLRRVIGACKVCKLRKRKCTHNNTNPAPSSVNSCAQQISRPLISPEGLDIVPPSIGGGCSQNGPPGVPQGPQDHDSESSAKESQVAFEQQSDFAQICANQGTPIPWPDENVSPPTRTPDQDSRDSQAIQDHERSPPVQRPPRAHSPPTNATDVLFSEDSYWAETENGLDIISQPPPARRRRSTLSPTLPTAAPPELLRREPYPEDARRKKRKLSPHFPFFSFFGTQRTKDAGGTTKGTEGVTSSTPRIPSLHRNPLDDVYLLDPKVMTRETMFESHKWAYAEAALPSARRDVFCDTPPYEMQLSSAFGSLEVNSPLYARDISPNAISKQ